MELNPVEKEELLQHTPLPRIQMAEAAQSSRALDYLEYSSDFVAGYVGGSLFWFVVCMYYAMQVAQVCVNDTHDNAEYM